MYNRFIEDDRFSGRQILSELQWRLDTMISAGGFSARQMLVGSNPADLFGWEDADEDTLFTQDA